MGFRFDIAIRTTHKYAVQASGDVARVIDLPDAGVAVLVIDGQGSGRAARAVARSVATRLAEMLESGASAASSAMAANEILYSDRGGQVSVSFDIVRAAANGTIEIAGYSTNTGVIFDIGWKMIDANSVPAGHSYGALPRIARYDVGAVSAIVLATDGIATSYRSETELLSSLQRLGDSIEPCRVAETLFEESLVAADGRPKDDLTVAVMALSPDPADQRIERTSHSRSVR